MKKYLPAGISGRKICKCSHSCQEKQYRDDANADGKSGNTVQNPVCKIAGFCGVGIRIAFHGAGRIMTVDSSSFHM